MASAELKFDSNDSELDAGAAENSGSGGGDGSNEEEEQVYDSASFFDECDREISKKSSGWGELLSRKISIAKQLAKESIFSSHSVDGQSALSSSTGAGGNYHGPAGDDSGGAYFHLQLSQFHENAALLHDLHQQLTALYDSENASQNCLLNLHKHIGNQLNISANVDAMERRKQARIESLQDEEINQIDLSKSKQTEKCVQPSISTLSISEASIDVSVSKPVGNESSAITGSESGAGGSTSIVHQLSFAYANKLLTDHIWYQENFASLLLHPLRDIIANPISSVFSLLKQYEYDRLYRDAMVNDLNSLQKQIHQLVSSASHLADDSHTGSAKAKSIEAKKSDLTNQIKAQQDKLTKATIAFQLTQHSILSSCELVDTFKHQFIGSHLRSYFDCRSQYHQAAEMIFHDHIHGVIPVPPAAENIAEAVDEVVDDQPSSNQAASPTSPFYSSTFPDDDTATHSSAFSSVPHWPGSSLVPEEEILLELDDNEHTDSTQVDDGHDDAADISIPNL